ncbi:MAG TPA: sulfite exporter TauE/SafE family protein, partial [Cryobacterium sp.]|nr:sulfite exporter TauE/SafE family protein [Cryobacterium sp.]
LLGVGGGFLIVPALTLILGLPMSVTVGTSLVIIVINSLAGFAAHLGDVQIDWAVTGAFAASAMVASLVAGRLVRGLSDVILKRGFAVLVLLVAVYVAIKAITA